MKKEFKKSSEQQTLKNKNLKKYNRRRLFGFDKDAGP